MSEAVIVSAVRTPIGAFMGSLSGVPATEPGSIVVAEAVRRAGIDPGTVDEVLTGNVLSAGLGQNPARQAALGGGIPETVPATTINAAENVAAEDEITREDQDAFALRCQQRAVAAIEAGVLAREIVPVSVPARRGDPMVVDRDEHPRAETTAEGLARLRPAFAKDGTVTAGSSSGINDGAGVRVLTTLLHEMERGDHRLGLAALCIGGGQGIAMVVERAPAA